MLPKGRDWYMLTARPHALPADGRVAQPPRSRFRPGFTECAGTVCCTDDMRLEVIDDLIVRQLVQATTCIRKAIT